MPSASNFYVIFWSNSLSDHGKTRLVTNFMRIFTVFILIALCIALLLWTKPETKAELQPLPPARVVSTTVQTLDMVPVLVLTGKFQPVRRAQLQFELSGQINVRNVESGQAVKEGEVLLSIFDGDYQDKYTETLAELELEQANLGRDKQQLELLVKEKEIQQREVERLEQLRQKSLASKSNYDSASQALLKIRSEESRLRSSVNSSSSKLKLRQAKINMAKRNLQRTELRAPFNATVNSVNVELGDYTRSGEVAIELVQLDDLDLYLEVTGKTMVGLSVGQLIEVTIHDEKYMANIIAIEPDPKADTLTHAIRIRMQGKDLYSGQLAKAHLPSEMLKNVAAVPLSAILYEEGQVFVYQIELDHHLRRVPVKLLARQGDLQAITGIEGGVSIVAQDVAALTDGQKISIDE